jgi:hypothetical protein
MKNKLFKTCFTGIVLSVASLANADDSGGLVNIFTPQLTSHAAISGAALSIAAVSVVDGNLAAQAAVTIGAGLNTQTQNIYSGAAVTTGAQSTVKNIFSGAATGLGAGAHAENVHAGAAITVGAGGEVHGVYAGAAITYGAGVTYGEGNHQPKLLDETANTASDAPEDIHNATSMKAAIDQIGVAQAALSTLIDTTTAPLYTAMGGFEVLAPGVHQGGAVNIAANSVVKFSADNQSSEPMNHVWVINLSEALTVGAATVFETEVPEGDTATIIWNVGAAVTLGAGSKFIGTAFVGGAFGAATSDVSCGNIYAIGAVSVGSIGALGVEDGVSNPVACDTNASELADFEIKDGAFSLGGTTYEIGDNGPAGGIVFHITDDGAHGYEMAPQDQEIKSWSCSITNVGGAVGHAVGDGADNTNDMIMVYKQICQGMGTFAATVASGYELNKTRDWFLPSVDSLVAMSKVTVDGSTPVLQASSYWSSSQLSGTRSGYVHSMYVAQDYRGMYEKGFGSKLALRHIRSIRAF